MGWNLSMLVIEARGLAERLGERALEPSTDVRRHRELVFGRVRPGQIGVATRGETSYVITGASLLGVQVGEGSPQAWADFAAAGGGRPRYFLLSGAGGEHGVALASSRGEQTAGFCSGAYGEVVHFFGDAEPFGVALPARADIAADPEGAVLQMSDALGVPLDDVLDNDAFHLHDAPGFCGWV